MNCLPSCSEVREGSKYDLDKIVYYTKFVYSRPILATGKHHSITSITSMRLTKSVPFQNASSYDYMHTQSMRIRVFLKEKNFSNLYSDCNRWICVSGDRACENPDDYSGEYALTVKGKKYHAHHGRSHTQSVEITFENVTDLGRKHSALWLIIAAGLLRRPLLCQRCFNAQRRVVDSYRRQRVNLLTIQYSWHDRTNCDNVIWPELPRLRILFFRRFRRF